MNMNTNMKGKLVSALRAVGVAESSVATFVDVYECWPWGDTRREEWTQKFIEFVNRLAAVKPSSEARQILDLQAQRITAAYAGDAAAHAKAVEDLTAFFKAHSAA